MKKYIVTYTYQAMVEAKNKDEALNKVDDLFDEDIINGNKPFNIDIAEIKKTCTSLIEQIQNSIKFHCWREEINNDKGGNKQ